MAVNAVLFDLDGTLLNTLDDLTDSANFAMRAMGVPEHTTEEVCSYINNGARHLITSAMPSGTPADQIDACVKIFKAHYADNLANKTRPYPGIIEALDQLNGRGVRCAVVSNKFDGAVKALSKQYFGGRLAAAVGENEAAGVRRKPAPDSVYKALEALGVAKENALYVGDTNVDIETANNAGLRCLSVAWGFRPRSVLVEAGAARIIDRVDELVGAILSY